MTKGHPKGLYPLFFTEMWERLGFYLMVGILVLYAVDTERGGLGMTKGDAAEIMGTYLAFVYFTPFLGGMIADRFLGFRLSVLIGGLTMAAGFFLLGIRDLTTFYGGLFLLCCGNGLFKPNISAMVGNLYEPGDPRRDAGFNIFYMGINIGASISALASAPLRNLFNFNIAFIAAGVGLLIGVTILLANWKNLARADVRSQPDADDVSFLQVILTILLPAGACGFFFAWASGQSWFPGHTFIMDTIKPTTFGFIMGMIPVIIYFLQLVRKSKPEEKAGLGALIPVFVCGGAFFMILHLSAGLMTFFTEENTKRPGAWIPDNMVTSAYKQKAMPSYFKNADAEVPRPDERVMVKVDDRTEALFGAKRLSSGALAQVLGNNPNLAAVAVTEKERYQSSWGLLTCKVFPDDLVEIHEGEDHGRKVISVKVPETAKPLKEVAITTTIGGAAFPVFLVTDQTFSAVYAKASEARIPPGEYLDLFNAELVTGLFNPIFVVILTPLVVAFFAFMVRRKREISTARKIFIGMILTTISLGIIAYASYLGGDGASKVNVGWLAFYFLIITAGELCLSPMGLSLVTKLSPKRLVGLMMGGWFLSTAIGNKLSGFISGLQSSAVMFLVLGGFILFVALIILCLLPKLDRAIKKYGA